MQRIANAKIAYINKTFERCIDEDEECLISSTLSSSCTELTAFDEILSQETDEEGSSCTELTAFDEILPQETDEEGSSCSVLTAFISTTPKIREKS
jgi:hypothetical protein